MFGDNQDNRAYAKELGSLLSQLVLYSITLAVPNDHSLAKEPCYETDWWMWTLHGAAVKAFRAGRITKVRFAHSAAYAVVDVTRFLHYTYIRETLLGEEWQEWQAYCLETMISVQEQGHLGPCLGTPLTIEIMVNVQEAMWKQLGFRVRVDECREGEKGTVLVLHWAEATAA